MRSAVIQTLQTTKFRHNYHVLAITKEEKLAAFKTLHLERLAMTVS